MEPVATQTAYRSHWFLKFTECFFASLAVLNFLTTFLEIAPRSFLMAIGQNGFMIIMAAQAAVPLLFGIIYATWWHKKEKQHSIHSGYRHAWFRGILRYWLAFSIATYGFAKVFKTQFGVNYHRDDTVASAMSGFDLTWNYFGHSYTMTLIIAACQIIGAALLLFRRTTLMGVLILLPVMLNIMLINIFYDIASGAFINSVIFTLGLIYLGLLRWRELRPVLLGRNNHLPVVSSRILRTAGKVVAILGSCLLLAYLASSNPDSKLMGKWKVDKLTRNGVDVPADAWLKDSTAYTTVYVEQYNNFLLCPNPYVYDRKRSTWAESIFAPNGRSVQLVHYKNNRPSDTASLNISQRDSRHVVLSGVLDKLPTVMQLSRIR